MDDGSDPARSFASYRGPLGRLGPTVEDDVRRAIQRYGLEEVEAAVKRIGKRRAGRRQIDDMAELRPIFEKDANEWLQGGDPFKWQTNYAIAQDKAKNLKVHQQPAAIDRVERKLRTKPFDRKWHTLVAAWNISFSMYPFALHMRVLAELANIDPEWLWSEHINDAELLLAAYMRKMGQRPPEKLTMEQVKEALSPAIGALPFVPKEPTAPPSELK